MSLKCFGVGILNPKYQYNVGTLFRSAYQLGASFVFVIGDKYKPQITDTYKCHENIPVFQFKNFEEFKKSQYNMPIVAIEFDRKSSVLIKDYEHRIRCVYLLGTEDVGLPKNIVEECQDCVHLDSVRTPSYNVHIAGSIVMYDRLNKLT